MDKSIIEGNAVDYVKLALRATGIIDPYIKEADKTPSWDGELFVYNSDNFNKSNLKSIIPVQVKGRSFKKYRNTFQVELSDLINYKKRQNVIYFLVQFVGTEYKIYYTKLKQDINRLIAIKDESKALDIKLACCILLESKIEIEKYLSEMEP